MRLSQKKNCNGCKALDLSSGRQNCEINGKPVTTKTCAGRTIECAPSEPCLKPMTNEEWLEARRILRERLNPISVSSNGQS